MLLIAPLSCQCIVDLFSHPFRCSGGVRPEQQEYVAVVDAVTLEALSTVDRRGVILAAVWFGDVRLIDNQLLD